MDNKKNRIFIVAGEASGDKHAAHFVELMKIQCPDTEFEGIGGAEMRAVGVNTRVDSSIMCLMGPYEILTQGHRVVKVFRETVAELQKNPPDLLVLVDYPEFNLRLAKKAKKAGIKVLYYISPQLWAWRKWRVKTVQKYVDTMAVIFPFEVDFYKKHGVKAYYIGHPFADRVYPTMNATEAREKLGLNTAKRYVGLLPGSRRFEVQRLLPRQLKAAELMQGQHADLEFILPLASTLKRDMIQPYLEAHPQLTVHIIENRLYDAVQACDAAISAFGTVTLEVSLLGIPQVLIYTLSPLTALLAFFLVHVKFYGICNYIADEEIAPELVQFSATPARIAKAANRFLDDANYRSENIQKLSAMRECLAHNPQMVPATDLALALLKQ